MKIVNQSAHIIEPTAPMKHIERIGRVCYKSEDKIDDGTDKNFVKMLFSRKHFAMLEHYRFIMRVPCVIYKHLAEARPRHVEMTNENNNYIISLNARALIGLQENCSPYSTVAGLIIAGIRDELIGHIVKRYDCHELFGWSRDKSVILSANVEFIENNELAMLSPHEYSRHGWFSAHFITDRGITHELVRHREEISFAQESTRYCNYGSDRFDDITVIDQDFEDGSYIRDQWIIGCEMACDCYSRMLSNNVTPQMARSVLPTCLKTEIIMTAPIYEWNHVFDLRLNGITGAPHPKMKELMRMLCDDIQRRENNDTCSNHKRN